MTFHQDRFRVMVIQAALELDLYNLPECENIINTQGVAFLCREIERHLEE